MPSRVGPEIHRRLADGQPPDLIGKAVGRSLSTIYDHRARKCRCCDVADNPDLRELDNLVAAFDPVLVPALPMVEAGSDIPPLPTVAMVLEVGLTERDAEVLMRVWKEDPDAWPRFVRECRRSRGQ